MYEMLGFYVNVRSLQHNYWTGGLAYVIHCLVGVGILKLKGWWKNKIEVNK